MALRAHARMLAVSASILFGSLAAGCSGAAPSADEDISLADEAVTDVNHSSVKRQSIGNCWVYATVGWAESLNKTATGVEQNYSESYVTFWSWYDRLTTGQVTGSELSTGGSFGYGTTLLGKYGLVSEGDFIAEEATVEMSARQKAALTYINESLKNGKLKTSTARKNRATVKAELVAAWKLAPAVVAKLDALFGADLSKNLTQTSSGKPVVSTRTPSFTADYDGVLFFSENETAAAFARAIDRALALTPAERESHRDTVARFVTRHGEWPEVTAAFLRWAAECVVNPDGPATGSSSPAR